MEVEMRKYLESDLQTADLGAVKRETNANVSMTNKWLQVCTAATV